MIDLKTVLVPTDFSELSLQALPYAWELARQHHAEIVLAHSCLHACDLDLVRKRLENLATLLDPLPHRIECRVAAPVDFLVELTSGMDRALMILVTHAFRGTDRQVMGSVAERLVSRCPIAVLTLKTQRGFLRELEQQAEVLPDPAEVRGPELRARIKSRDDFFFEQQDRRLVAESREARRKEQVRHHGKQTHAIHMKSLLVPVDFSDRSERAVEVANELAREYGAEINLLHVLEEGLRGKGRPTREAQRLEVAREKLQEFKERLVDVPCDIFVEGGTAASTIVDRAARLDVDLVVMASRGKRSLVGIPLGSTARSVVHRASCPVLTLKGPTAGQLLKKASQEAASSS